MPTHPQNADPVELDKFNALAERWWDPNGEFKPLHDINPLRVRFIEERIPGGVAGKRILDVGCGGGILAEALACRGAEVTAIDLAPAPLAVARIHAEEANISIRYESIAAEALAAQEPGCYDVVTCLEMLEHVPSPQSTVAACAALAKADGQVFFATINRNPKSYLFAIVGAEYVLGLLPRGTHDFAKFIRPSELDHYAREASLALETLTGMHYSPLTDRYRLGPGVAVNYLAHYSCTRSIDNA